ncbi:MAG: dockerin type I repeat-containing protein, partial [Oscillospiraceae bacterium]|nr:dockerin type I repeat-containing protein [Oscillospiraceae bacterium]
GDGAINSKDVTLMRRFLAGGYSVTLTNELIADTNKDGVVNAKDVTILRRYLADGYGVVLD